MTPSRLRGPRLCGDTGGRTPSSLPSPFSLSVPPTPLLPPYPSTPPSTPLPTAPTLPATTFPLPSPPPTLPCPSHPPPPQQLARASGAWPLPQHDTPPTPPPPHPPTRATQRRVVRDSRAKHPPFDSSRHGGEGPGRGEEGRVGAERKQRRHPRRGRGGSSPTYPGACGGGGRVCVRGHPPPPLSTRHARYGHGGTAAVPHRHGGASTERRCAWGGGKGGAHGQASRGMIGLGGDGEQWGAACCERGGSE